MEIKNIILDLGGVLLNIDYHKTIRAFTELGIAHFETIYSQLEQVDFFSDYEKGKIDDASFLGELKKYLPEDTSDEAIVNAWNAMLLDFPDERIEFLQSLKGKYNLVLLSNTNFIHLRWFHNYLSVEKGIVDFSIFFDEVYYSCEMGMRKPDAEIFKHVCELENFIPEETLFIDDSPQHVEGAKSIGIQAHWLDLEREEVKGLFSRVVE